METMLRGRLRRTKDLIEELVLFQTGLPPSMPLNRVQAALP